MLNPTSTVVQLGVRARTLRFLKQADVGNVDALLLLNEAELQNVGLDDKAITDVRACLKLHGLKLQPPPPATSTNAVASAFEPSLYEEPKALENGLSRFLSVETAVDDVSNEDDESQFFEEADEQRLESLAEAMLGIQVRKKAKKADTLTDAKRTSAAASRALAKDAAGPDVTDPEDRTRLLEIFKRPLMDVPEAAWLYGVSIDLIYREVKKQKIPHRRLGDRVKILTAPAYAELYPDGIK